jgi:hypothetical protein
MAENVLSPLRQRIARHLLDLAVQEGDEVLVPVTVQDLAHATGTVREVVPGSSKTCASIDSLAARGIARPASGPGRRGGSGGAA